MYLLGTQMFAALLKSLLSLTIKRKFQVAGVQVNYCARLSFQCIHYNYSQHCKIYMPHPKIVNPRTSLNYRAVLTSIPLIADKYLLCRHRLQMGEHFCYFFFLSFFLLCHHGKNIWLMSRAESVRPGSVTWAASVAKKPLFTVHCLRQLAPAEVNTK